MDELNILFSTFTKLNLLTSISPHHNYQKCIQFQDFNPICFSLHVYNVNTRQMKTCENII